MTDPLLKVTDLIVGFKQFGGIAHVIDGVTFEVGENEVVALVGETGCGKSLTLKSIAQSLSLKRALISGSILLKGNDLLKMSEKDARKLVRKYISMIPQNVMTSLSPRMTIGQQLSELIYFKEKESIRPWQIFSGVPKSEKVGVEEKAMEILHDVSMPDPEKTMKSYPFELSGGMMQRVLIALALCGNPILLLADEPGTALDVTTFSTILEMLNLLIKEGSLSMIYVTHNLAVARRISQRICIMYAGDIVESGRTYNIYADAMHPYTKALIQSVPKLTKTPISGIGGRIPDYQNPPTGCRFHPRCKWSKKICKTKKPTQVSLGNDHSVKCHLFS
jgi:oligopeptide/dipeptide ABC transporter ATP-binding protein